MGDADPAQYLVGKKTDPGVTNIRNVNSAHWRRWLGVESRCVVPFTSFSENEVMPDGSRPPIWFALNENAAAGILRRHLDAKVDLRAKAEGGRGDR